MLRGGGTWLRVACGGPLLPQRFARADYLDMYAGAYTTARTVHRTSVFDLTFHINRLAETARLMCDQSAKSPDGAHGASTTTTRLPEALLSGERLRPLVVQALRTAISHFEAQNSGHNGELKLTVLTHGAGDRPNVCAHVSLLPPRPAPPVKVQVRRHDL